LLTNKPKHILIAPLDWGLGHTTRCVPLISYIQSLGHNVTVAGNASQRAYIEETFGLIDFIHLEGYNIRYSEWNKWAQTGLLSQSPAIKRTINSEHKWLQKLSAERKIDGIISDNRYGLFHPDIPSVILTHQLQVQTGLGPVANLAVQKIHYHLLNRFNATWVVDVPGTPNLGGNLSHSSAQPRHTKYIGLLSRFANIEEVPLPENEGEECPLVILLSGPEPQRSILSRVLWQQSLGYEGKMIFIEGSELATPPDNIPPPITYYKRLTHQQLAPILQKAGMAICRSGYSTLMDLVALGKKAILIPTPGQTEQLYLGRHLHKQDIFYSTSQQGFNLASALNEANQFPYNPLKLQPAYNLHKDVLDKWLAAL